jgi:hypothetical protein
MWVRLAFIVLGYRWFQLSLFSSTRSCLLRFALLYICSVLVSVIDSSSKKSLYDVASATSIYHHMLMTDGIATLLGIYMKKRGIDLSSLASSLWEFMPAIASIYVARIRIRIL